MNLTEIRATLLDGTTKGIPGSARPFPLSAIAAQGWNVLREDLPFPLMLLKRAALDHNARVFETYLSENGLSFSPHGKTTMTPQLFAEQLAHGAWAITAATVNQVMVMRRFGISRIILANQLIGRAAIEAIAAEINGDPGFDFYAFVDSVGQLRNIERHLEGTALAHPVKLLVEMGVAGGRTGVRSIAEGLALVEALMPAVSKLLDKGRFPGVGGRAGGWVRRLIQRAHPQHSVFQCPLVWAKKGF